MTSRVSASDENVRARTLDLTHSDSIIPLRLARAVSRGAVSLNQGCQILMTKIVNKTNVLKNNCEQIVKL